LVSDNALEMQLNPAPINPDWFLDGNPQARAREQSASRDRAAYAAIWDCTAGTFRWYFGWDETVCILEGEVHVTDAEGLTRTLRAGDVAYFTG
ncbi:cupin domain-containing protein, partial [Stenotrophomonas maltophilia]|uniref:cupin domain-containing protein n=1 Tax=Stenotrophomonas maltophilia TaxID=40324 RepID=UPI0013DC74F1